MKLAIAALLALAPALGCTAGKQEYVRPWFRVVTDARAVIIPDAIAVGGEYYPEVRVADGWQRLPHFYFSAQGVGDAVAVRVSSLHGPVGVQIYRQGRVLPVADLTAERCPTPIFSDARGEIACFSCDVGGRRLPLANVNRGRPCGTLHVDMFDTHGRPTGQRTVASPAIRPFVEGRLPDGAWILAEEEPGADDFFVGGVPKHFQLGASGVTELPVGADPFGQSTAHERARTAEIVAQRAGRDAVVAAMRAAFEDEERGHPSWVRREEIVTRLVDDQRTAGEMPVELGTCYTLVARGTDGLTRLDVSFHRERDSVPESAEETRAGGLAFATGRRRVSVTRCVATLDPPHYDYRIASRGTGDVVARVYAHPPE